MICRYKGPPTTNKSCEQINLVNHMFPIIFSDVITFDLELYIYKQLHILTCMNDFVEYNATQLIFEREKIIQTGSLPK